MPSQPLPVPEPGLVVRFGYRWADQPNETKDRPCCIILVTELVDPRNMSSARRQPIKRVVYLPITTRPRRESDVAIEIPLKVAQHLKLKDERSWIVPAECNVQFWPNDLAVVPGQPAKWVHGYIPPKLFRQIKEVFARELAARRVKIASEL